MPPTPRLAELIDAYAEGPGLIASALAGIPDDELRFTPGPGHWSIHENVAHVAEIDLIVAARIRFVLAMPGAPLLATDADRWARAFDYLSLALPGCLALMRAVRASTAELLRLASTEAWDHIGIHSKHGAQTLEWIVGHMVEHVDSHLKTIAKRRQQYAAASRAGAEDTSSGRAIT